VDVRLDLPGRLPRAVESAAYFVVREALANVARHSGAGRAEVRGGHDRGRLVVEIRDDGHGGADAAGGSGLTGLGDRLSVLDGRLSVSSPPGGPTVLRAEIPCAPPETDGRSDDGPSEVGRSHDGPGDDGRAPDGAGTGAVRERGRGGRGVRARRP
jgi:signal transduction histidine kinase